MQNLMVWLYRNICDIWLDRTIGTVLGLLAGWLLPVVIHPAHAGTEPVLYSYACADNGLAECRTATPPFDTCAEWGSWFCTVRPPPPGSPCTHAELPFSGFFGERGKQCIGNGRSIAFGGCQTPGYTATAPDSNGANQLCVGAQTLPKPHRQFGPSCPSCGDPINPAPSVGNKYEVALDYAGSGPFALKLERYYNSAAVQVYPGNSLQPFAFSNWRHSYERRVASMVRAGTSFARVDRKDGNSLYYTLAGASWQPEDSDVTERLEQALENRQPVWRFTNREDEVERYSVQTGNFLSITNRAGLTRFR